MTGFCLLECFLDFHDNHEAHRRTESETREDPGALSDPAGAAPNDTQGEGVPRQPGLAGRRGWAGLFLSVNWDTRSSFEQAVRSGSGGAFLGAVELLAETARVRIGNKETWEGIDALKRMRKKT